MTYEEALKYLYEQLPMFQRIGPAAYKANLNNTIRICDMLGNPHRHFRSIHIAGTNGKGSSSHMLASILQAKGLKTGLYTSPHLKDFRERIRIDGKMIPKAWVAKHVQYFKKDYKDIQPSFFEMTFGMAMRYFKEEKVDIAILETGMGGRLDSTNIAHPLVSVITNIGMDHSQFLGDSVEMIATEKAGIIKAGIPAIVGKHQNRTDEIFRFKAELEQTKLVFAQDNFSLVNLDTVGAKQPKLHFDIYKNDRPWISNVRCPLTGSYQAENIVTVIQTIDELIRQGFDIRKNHIIKGLNDVIKSTGIMGRWQILNNEPRAICDTGHNEDGVSRITAQIKAQDFKHLHFVLGMVNDKDISKILALLPKNATYYFCKADVPRGMPAENLQKEAAKKKLQGKVYESVPKAYEAALNAAKQDDLVFVGGSTFTVAEVV